MTEISNSMDEYENKVLNWYKDDCKTNGLLDIKGNSTQNELNRALIIAQRCFLPMTFGWIAESEKYAEAGLQYLEISRKRRQTKLLVDTVIPKELVEYHRLWFEYMFHWVIDKIENSEILEKMKNELFNNLSVIGHKNDALFQLANICIRVNDIRSAQELINIVCKSICIDITDEEAISIYDSWIIKIVIDALMSNADLTNFREPVLRLFNLFFKNLRIAPKGTKNKTGLEQRPIIKLANVSYLYYKYLRPDLGLNPLLIFQSTIFGAISYPVCKNQS